MKTFSFDVWTALAIVRGAVVSMRRPFRLDEGRMVVYARELSGNPWRDKAAYERYLATVADRLGCVREFLPNWEDGQKWNGGNVGSVRVRYDLIKKEDWRWEFSDGWPVDKPFKHKMEGAR